jgi:hypothetical protein
MVLATADDETLVDWNYYAPKIRSIVDSQLRLICVLLAQCFV